MASYAALLSLCHTLNQINIHPRPPISLDPEHLQFLTQNLTFFQHFLERYPSLENDDLESRIAAAAYAAEDVIENHIVYQIHDGTYIRTVDLCESLRRLMHLIKKEVMKTIGAQIVDISSVDLYRGLERVIQGMDLIKNEVMEIMEARHLDHLHTSSSVRPPASPWQNSSATVDFDDVLLTDVLDKLIGQQCDLQVIPIVGMGGIGKTTLARYIYSNQLIVQHFDILAWVTISQEYSRREILQVLYQETTGNKNDLSKMSEDELGEMLYKHVWGRRYLIVMDDIWSVDAWDQVKLFFSDNKNGSRIMITTRLSNLAFELSGSHNFQMDFLDDVKSWSLLCKTVFGKDIGCPIELENIGKEIARNCRGLPLSIVVIGGLLKKSDMTQAYWKYTLENLNSLVNLEESELCLQILRTSYKELPIHLKPCFLYMGVFEEDSKIKVTELIKLWVAEGILKPIDDKRLEEVAGEYVKELIDRNLVLVDKLRWSGKVKVCKIHDLLRDLCLREAQKQSFLRIPQAHTSRALKFETVTGSSLSVRGIHEAPKSLRLIDLGSARVIFQQANVQYISIETNSPQELSVLLSSCSLLWNLKTVEIVIDIFTCMVPLVADFEIWKMPLLRHVKLVGIQLPEPLYNLGGTFVLENLQTLSGVWNFNISEEVVKRIPNIKTLKVEYTRVAVIDQEEGLLNSCLNNFGLLQKLESFKLRIVFESISLGNLIFPRSLKKLNLQGTLLDWEELTTKAGSLPLLQDLKLRKHACRGPMWETIEGQFCHLKFLQIEECYDLKYWDTDSSHFPRLEHLILRFLSLEEIPLCIGDIPTLKSILLESCNSSAADSARRLKEEQEDNGNEDLKVLFGDE